MVLDPCENTARRDWAINQTYPMTSQDKKRRGGVYKHSAACMYLKQMYVFNTYMLLHSGEAVL